MDKQTLSELGRLRERLLSSAKTTEKLRELLEDREKLIEHIHSMLPEDPHLEEAKEQLVRIDHHIDDLEDATEHSEQVLRDKILLILSSEQAAAADAGIRLQEELARIRQKKEEVGAFLSSLKEVIRLIKEIEKIRGQVKQQGVVRFIFGRNPNFQISQKLKNIEEEGKKMEGSPLRIEAMKELMQVIEKPWNYKTLDRMVIPNLVPLEKQLITIEDLEQELMKRELDVEKDLEEWVERAF